MKNVRVAGAIIAKPSEKVLRIANANKLPAEPIESLIAKNEITETKNEDEAKTVEDFSKKTIKKRKGRTS